MVFRRCTCIQLVKRNTAIKDLPAIVVNEETERQEGNFLQSLVEKKVHVLLFLVLGAQRLIQKSQKLKMFWCSHCQGHCVANCFVKT